MDKKTEFVCKDALPLQLGCQMFLIPANICNDKTHEELKNE